ncbi:twin-arginine translocase TatA/TatE family subunit [Kiritimatiellaeota bacterium B1221]|nr:twin-arginine translocase TatA/TatE family subunit [Kiritimatiellaeota bacterium B1221]
MNTLPMLAFTPGPTELIIVLVLILILFGPKKLPDLSRAIGKSIGEFKRGRREVDEELKSLKEEDEAEETKPRNGNLG